MEKGDRLIRFISFTWMLTLPSAERRPVQFIVLLYHYFNLEKNDKSLFSKYDFKRN